MSITNKNQKIKVLIVDDESGNLHTMQDILSDNYAVIAASEGERALELAARQPQPDLILLDIKMPGMDGFEVLRRLKSDPVTSAIPVIFVTGLSEQTNEAKGLKMGAADYITKPINPDLLQLRVLTQLELRRYRRKLVSVFDQTSRLQQPSILIVDDNPENIHELVDALSGEYRIMVATNGLSALEHVHGAMTPDLILLDILMPEMDGYEVCRRLKATEEGNCIPVIFLSVMASTEEKVRGLSVGAVDYITKPFDIDEVRARVRTHLELTCLRGNLELMVKERTAELQESERNLRANLIDSIAALAHTLEMRDPYTSGHQQRVAHLAVAIAKEMKLSEEQIECINLAGVVHDVGKIQVPAEILSMPRRLTEIEFSLIKQHSQGGYEILKTINFPWPIAQIVLQHHERMDGSGYPQGLKGDAILLESRVIAVADTVEAMASHRPYRPGLGIEVALEEISRFRGERYDAQVVDACVALFKVQAYILTN